MKFNSRLDAQTFLMEIKLFDKLDAATEDMVVTDEELATFLKVRTPLVKKLKDSRKSSDQKANWRKNRYKMMKGIKAFHKSVEGKRFHRKLGRLIATRIFRTKTNESVEDMLIRKKEFLTGLNAAKQHLLVEIEFFHQLQEQIELEEFIIDYAYPYFRSLEEAVLQNRDLNDDELVFLFDIVEARAIVHSLADKSGQTFADVGKMWNTIASGLKKDKIDKASDRFYPLLIDGLKNKLGIK